MTEVSAPIEVEEDDFFASLNADIEKALAKSRMKTDAAALKKQAFDRTVGERVRANALAEWRALQALIDLEEWRPTHTVALFTEQNCDGCGSVHRVFLQFMQQEEQKRKTSNKRWVRVSDPAPGLARETIIQPHKTHICADCCIDHGFVVETAALLPVADSALIVSATYTQGDINVQA